MNAVNVALGVLLVATFQSFSQEAAATNGGDLLIQARAKAQAGLFTEAEALISRAIAASPADAQGHCALGVLQYNRGKYDAAIQSLTRAIALNPRFATAHTYLSLTAREKGWSEAADKELETASEIWRADRIASASLRSTKSKPPAAPRAEDSTWAKGTR